jgi:DNA transposition AAA+ family ATPase
MNEDGMGDHDDLSNGKKNLQLRILQEQDQPKGQLDEVIKEIRELMLISAQTTSEEKLGREKETIVVAQRKQQKQQSGADEKLQKLIWDPGGFPTAQRGSS